MTNVLHVISCLSLGGASRALVTCAEKCAEQDPGRHIIASLLPVASRKSAELALQSGLEVLDAPDVDTLRAAVKDSDLVHVHYWNTPTINEFLRLDLPHMRLLVKFNVGGEHPPHVITREIVNFADMVQTTGPFAHDLPVFDELDPEMRLAKVRMCYGAADFSRLKDFKPRAHDGYNVTYLGTVDFVKMHSDYVALSNSVREKAVKFIVCGGGRAFPVLRRQASELGALERFQFLEEGDDIGNILAITDVFGYPLCEDNYSSGELVLQEVAYAGIPAVIFPYGGAGRLVINDFTGYVVRSAAEYREALEYLYHFPEERTRLGRNAREYAVQLYGEENAARITLDIYKKMLSLTKQRRVFGTPDGGAFVSSSTRPTDYPLKKDGYEGAWCFIESMGEAAPWFLASLTSCAQTDQLEADERIACSSPAMVAGGLFHYREHYPDDGFLRYWCGLALQERGDDTGVAGEFLRALRSGCDHWRVHWNLAKCSIHGGETKMARESLLRVLRMKPSFFNAREMLDNLLERDKKKIYLRVLRFQRDAFFSAGEFLKSEQAGRAILGLKKEQANTEDIETYYKIGLELHKAGHIEFAKAVYKRVADDSRVRKEVAAWASFKHGELLLESGQEIAACTFFFQALEFNPNHTKALIFLVQPTEPLRVNLDGKKCDGYITVPMSPLNEELWVYYFARRSPDEVRIALNSQPSRLDAATLSGLLSEHLAPGGTAKIFMPAESGSEEMSEAVRILAQALNSTGLSVDSKYDVVTACTEKRKLVWNGPVHDANMLERKK